ncbi:hypothetical protein HYT01_02680 [Candidatus Giovannonibacteria bacterium]|nr:hypothetical protein [Candidatus Giovannonibacteria bacterium]
MNMLTKEYKTEPKDVFLHLLSIIALYVSVGSFVALIFQYITLLIPPPAVNYYSITSAYSSIRWNISALFVVFPLFVWSVWFLNRMYNKEPARREIWVRRWLINFTLFIAALVMVGDLVALIYNLLGGDWTSSFLLKILTIFVVSGLVFGYYFLEMKNRRDGYGTYIGYLAMALVVVSIISGFFFVGSPKEARLIQYDAQRVSDMQTIQSQILNFWMNKTRLPENLNELNDTISGYMVPTDPEGKAYEFMIRDKAKLSFALCAEFARPSDENSYNIRNSVPKPLHPAGEGISESWSHEAGKICFERTIDQELYRPYTDKVR